MKITLIKMGDFYEAFGKEARVLTEVLGVTLTRSSKGEPMAGIPAWSLDTYKAELEAAGHKVEVHS